MDSLPWTFTATSCSADFARASVRGWRLVLPLWPCCSGCSHHQCARFWHLGSQPGCKVAMEGNWGGHIPQNPTWKQSNYDYEHLNLNSWMAELMSIGCKVHTCSESPAFNLDQDHFIPLWLVLFKNNQLQDSSKTWSQKGSWHLVRSLSGTCLLKKVFKPGRELFFGSLERF